MLLYFIFFFLSFYFSPFYSEPCGGQALGAPAGHQDCATEVGDASTGHWSTRDLPVPCNIKWCKSPRDLHLNTNTQLHTMSYSAGHPMTKSKQERNRTPSISTEAA